MQQKLQIATKQQLALSQYMRQSIEIMQMSHMELAACMRAEMEENPFLEGEGVDDFTESFLEKEGVTSRADFSFDNMASKPHSLKEFLNKQLEIANITPIKKQIGAYLIDNIHPSGYFYENALEIARNLKCLESDVKEVLDCLKEFEPTGVFTGSLKECLELQLKEKGLYNKSYNKILNNLDQLASGSFAKLAKHLKIPPEKVREMFLEIKKLNPKPGSSFSDEIAQTIIPDLFLFIDENKIRVEINSECLPKIYVNEDYYAEVSKELDDDGERFCTEKFNSANWLVNAAAKRNATLLKVATEVVKHQEDFFRYGIYYLKPLKLEDISSALNMHISTISRSIAGKYIRAETATYPLKYFFTSSVSGANKDHSSEAVKDAIAKIISSEESHKPYSDDKISKILKERGINAARRTVAKYREAMNIAPSHKRKTTHAA